MASRDTGTDKLTLCCKCNQPLRSLRSLPCYHTFCERCVTKMCKGPDGTRVKCPQCKGGLGYDSKYMKKNPVLEMVLSQHKKRISNEKMSYNKPHPRCEHVNVLWKCEHCEICFCNACKASHVGLCGGTILSLLPQKEDLPADPPPGYQKVQVKVPKEVEREYLPLTCQYHPKEEAGLRCTQCKVMMCYRCKVEKHDTHRTNTAEDAFCDLFPILVSSFSESKDKGAHQNIQKLKYKDKMEAVDHYYNMWRDEVIALRDQKLKAIQEESDQLLGKIESARKAEIADFKQKKDDCEEASKLLDMMRQWGEAMALYVEGPAAVKELEGPFLRELKQLNHSYNLAKFRTALYDFVKAPLDSTKVGVLHQGMKTYRSRVPSLASFKDGKLQFSDEWKINSPSQRFYFYNNDIWIPCLTKDAIFVYNLSGRLVKKFNVELPHGMCPLNVNQILVLTKNGLLLMDSRTGKVMERLSEYDFQDICVDENNLAMLYSHEVYLTDFTPPVTNHAFEMTKPFATISFGDGKNIILEENAITVGRQKFDFDGRILPGQHPYHICASDTEKSRLVLDNNKTQDNRGQKCALLIDDTVMVEQTYEGELYSSWDDAFIYGDAIYVLATSRRDELYEGGNADSYIYKYRKVTPRNRRV